MTRIVITEPNFDLETVPLLEHIGDYVDQEVATARSVAALRPPFAAGQAASNTPLNSAAKRLMHRWVARKTGTITKLHFASIVGVVGYSAGTYGTWEVKTHPVNADGTPDTGTTLASESFNPGTRYVGGHNYTNLSPALSVEKGDEFATVWRNTDASPTANFASVNNFWREEYKAVGDTDYLYGVYGAQARNERDPDALDSYYGFDPREVLGLSYDSGATWLIPSAGYNTVKAYKEIPVLIQEYSDGDKLGNPYISATRTGFTSDRYETMVYNIQRDQTFTHVGAFIQGYSAPHSSALGSDLGATAVMLLVNDVMEANAVLHGTKFQFAPLGTSVSVETGDVVKLRYRYDLAGAHGVSFLHQYSDMNAVLGLGTSYEWYLSGSPTYAVPIWPLPYLKVSD